MYSSEYQRIEKLENSHFWYRAMDEMILNLAGHLADGKGNILDAGCGTGGLSTKLMRYGKVTGIDINPVALKYAKEKKLNRLLKASVEKLPFPDNYFHLAVCLDVLYHRKVKNDIGTLCELNRVIKPGGKLILRLPAFEWLRGAHDKVVQTKHRFTAEEVEIQMKKAGFRIIKLTYANMILSVPLFVKRFYERIRRKRIFSSDTVIPNYLLNEFLYQILSKENQLLRYINLPFGSSVISVGSKK